MNKPVFKTTLLSLSAAVVLGLAGCSSGDSGSDGVQGSLDTTLSGVGIDGYLSQATVCLDLNLDGYCQIDDEPATSTKDDGSFSLALTPAQKLKYEDWEKAPLLIYSGYDVDTGADFTGKLRANLGDGKDINVSPLSTAVKAVMDSDSSTKTEKEKEAAAEALVKDMLGLDSEADLKADPVAAAKTDPALLKAALKLQKTVEVLAVAKKQKQEDTQAGSSDSANKLVEDLYKELAQKAAAATTDVDKKLAAAVTQVVADDGELDADAEGSATAIGGQIELIIGDDGVADTAVIGTKIGAVKQELVVAIESDAPVPSADDLNKTANTDFSLLHAKEILRIVDMEDKDTSENGVTKTLSTDVQTVLKAGGMTEAAFLPVDDEIKLLKADPKTFLVGANFEDFRNAGREAEQARLEAEAQAAAEKAALEAKIAELEGALKEAAQAEADAADAKAKADAEAAAAAAEAERLARLAKEAEEAAKEELITAEELQAIADAKAKAEAEQAEAESKAKIQEHVVAVIEIDSQVKTTMLDVNTTASKVMSDIDEIMTLDASYELGDIATDANASATSAKTAADKLPALVETIATAKTDVLTAQSENNETNAQSAEADAKTAFETFNTELATAIEKAAEVAKKLVDAKAIKTAADAKPPVVGADNVFTLPFEWSDTYVYNNGQVDVLKVKRNMFDANGYVTEIREEYNLATGELLIDDDNNSSQDLKYELVDGAWASVDQTAQAQVTLSSDGTVAHYSIANADLRIVSVRDLSSETTFALSDELSIPVTFREGAKATQYEYRFTQDRYTLNGEQINYATQEGGYFTSLEDFIKAYSTNGWFMGSPNGGVTFASDINGTLVPGVSSGNMKEMSQNGVVNENIGTWEYREIDSTGIYAIFFDITSGSFEGHNSEFFTMYAEDGESNVYNAYVNKATSEYKPFDQEELNNEVAYEDVKSALATYFSNLESGGSEGESNTTAPAPELTPYVLSGLMDGKAFYELHLENEEIKIHHMAFSTSTNEFEITFDRNSSDTATFMYDTDSNGNNLAIMDPNTNETLSTLSFYQSASSAAYFAVSQEMSDPSVNMYYFVELEDALHYVENASFHNLIGGTYYEVGYTPGQSDSAQCRAKFTYTAEGTTAVYMSGATESSAGTEETFEFGFVADQSVLVKVDTLDNGSGSKYRYTQDFSKVGTNDVTTVGLFTTKSDATAFLSEKGFNDCSHYFPE